MSSVASVADLRMDHWLVRSTRRIFSFPVTLSFMLIVLAVVTVRSRFYDPDMWWHLKSGEIITTTHTIPVTDIFSYTTNHHSSVPHEWLSQVFIYGAYKAGGYSGLMLWLCILTSCLLVAGYALCSLYSGNAKVGFAGALIVWLFSTVGLAVRPHMVGYLLLMAELIFIHLGRTRSPRWFFALPPLFALWINCHGSFFLGIIVAGIYVFCSFFHFQVGSLIAPRWNPHTRRMLVLALLLLVAPLFLNPIGAGQVFYPINTLLHQNIGLSQVQEWMPLQLTSERGIALLAVLACLLLIELVQHSQIYLHELLLIAFCTWSAASHARLIFAFGIVAAPILSRLLSNAWDSYDPEEDRPLPNTVMILASLLICFFAFPGKQNLTTQVEEHSPVKAVEFIKTNHLSGNMLNDYILGGFLIWAAPEHPVFLDGRSDVFEWTGVLEEFGDWAMLQTDPKKLLDKYNIEFCVLSSQSPMVTVLPLLPNWKLAYSDKNAVIFVRTIGGDQSQ
jgi:hypothetical protein